uniref:Uncharacterized protein n=1 Tax=Oryza rufipogon TaxID=4529 RepID=A0A0E0NA26_ORYRU
MASLLLLLIVATSAMACVEQEKSSLLRFIAELSQDGGIAMSWQNGMDCCCGKASPATKMGL